VNQHERRDLATLTDNVEPATHSPTPDVVRRARSAVATHAHDRDDLRLLLDALGLTAVDGEPARDAESDPQSSGKQ
jgi:hypothetical protein